MGQWPDRQGGRLHWIRALPNGRATAPDLAPLSATYRIGFLGNFSSRIAVL